jgi:hypothetical protein
MSLCNSEFKELDWYGIADVEISPYIEVVVGIDICTCLSLTIIVSIHQMEILT